MSMALGGDPGYARRRFATIIRGTTPRTMMPASPFQMPDYVISRVMQKRGRLRVFDRFAPAETALVVIDMQRYYIGDRAAPLAIIPAINRLAAGFRAKGAAVAWVSMTAGEGGQSLWPLYHEYFF